MTTETDRRIHQVLMIAISKVEELEQEVEALKNQAPSEFPSEFDYIVSKEELARVRETLAVSNQYLAIVKAERNALSQALRIVASHGQIDPVEETEEMEDHEAV